MVVIMFDFHITAIYNIPNSHIDTIKLSMLGSFETKIHTLNMKTCIICHILDPKGDIHINVGFIIK